MITAEKFCATCNQLSFLGYFVFAFREKSNIFRQFSRDKIASLVESSAMAL